MFKGKIYNTETKGYSYCIQLDEIESFKDKLLKLEARIEARKEECKQNKPSFNWANDELEINNLEAMKEFVETEGFKINSSINNRRASLFLVACYFCSETEVLEYLLEQDIEINRVDMLGYNALMSLILNEHMFEDDKLEIIKLLVEKGIDINWLNFEDKSALHLALETTQLNICHVLLDYKAYVK